jgi:protein-disulfide isomerase
MRRNNGMNKLTVTLMVALAALFAQATQAASRPKQTPQQPAPKQTQRQQQSPGQSATAPKEITPAPKEIVSAPKEVVPARREVVPEKSAVVPASEDCGCESKPLPEVVAVVNGIKISVQDFSPEVGQRVEVLRRQVVEARKRELDLQINSRLLDAEAKKRGVTAAKVIEAEIISKAVEPTDADAQAFYETNRARIQGEFKDVKADIIGYLRDQRQREQARKLSDTLRASSQVKKFFPEATPPASTADRARVFATVNGQNITSADIEDSLRPLIFSVQEKTYKLRNQDIERKVNDLLLEQEAQKSKVTTRALLDAEIEAKVRPITEADAQKFYDENKTRIDGDFAQTKEQIIQYLRDGEKQKATVALAQRLRGAARVQNFLTPPEPPSYAIATDDQPTKGNPAAAITIVEFTDFQCPACAQAQPAVERIAQEYGDRVRLVVRDFPLHQHENASKAAEAAEAAREQGKYWEYAAVLFQNQTALQVDRLKEYASRLGLDRTKFDASLDSGRFADKVRRDVLDGQSVGVGGTPTLYLNGRRIADASYEGIRTAIEAALKAPSK